MESQRHYSFIDQLCLGIDQSVRVLFGTPLTSARPNPTASMTDSALTDTERQQSAALMRVNHAGEVCAQALYQAQALVSRDEAIQSKMRAAAIEEGDHLAWCKTRLHELDSHPSYLNPLWYMGSFYIGLLAGLVGDRWSLGFVAETERQVVRHLAEHATLLPENDRRSFAILSQMEQDEALHRDAALEAGAAMLPQGIKRLMHWASRVMVKVAYYV
jgi:ubiquinone biosynthesis monooxygenase Coq7